PDLLLVERSKGQPELIRVLEAHGDSADAGGVAERRTRQLNRILHANIGAGRAVAGSISDSYDARVERRLYGWISSLRRVQFVDLKCSLHCIDGKQRRAWP